MWLCLLVKNFSPNKRNFIIKIIIESLENQSRELPESSAIVSHQKHFESERPPKVNFDKYTSLVKKKKNF